MKFLSTLFIILFSFGLASGQEKEKGKQWVTTTPYEPSTKLMQGFSTKAETKLQVQVIDFDQLPDKIVLVFQNGKQRDTKLEFTKTEIWRFITYFHDAYLEHINRAYDMDQPKDAK